MAMPDWSSITQQLRDVGISLGDVASDAPATQAVGGGDISAAWRLATPSGDIFIKEYFGRTDLNDVFRFTSVVDQEVALNVTFTGIDPVSSNPNEVGAAIRRTGQGSDLALVPPAPQPVVLTFDALAGESYDVDLSIATGHAAYVARFVLSASVSPKPSRRSVEGAE